MERLTGRRGGRGERTQAAGKKHTVSNRTEKNVREGIKKKKKSNSAVVVYNFSRGVEGICWCLCATTPQPTPSL